MPSYRDLKGTAHRLVCDVCGAVVDDSARDVHDEWHLRYTMRVPPLDPATGPTT
jgi:hypothetical protein